MSPRILALAACLSLPIAARAEEPKRATVGTIERLDPKFDELIPRDAAMEVLAGGFAWSEGPVWVKDGGYLLFSDIPNNRRLQVVRARTASRPTT